jgi:hypothetical protein
MSNGLPLGKLKDRGVFLNRRFMDALFFKRVNSWQGLVKKEQDSIFVKSMIQFHTLKSLKSLLVRRCRVADGTAGQKKFFKVKYLFCAFSYGAKIHRGTYSKNI